MRNDIEQLWDAFESNFVLSPKERDLLGLKEYRLIKVSWEVLQDSVEATSSGYYFYSGDVMYPITWHNESFRVFDDWKSEGAGIEFWISLRDTGYGSRRAVIQKARLKGAKLGNTCGE